MLRFFYVPFIVENVKYKIFEILAKTNTVINIQLEIHENVGFTVLSTLHAASYCL